MREAAACVAQRRPAPTPLERRAIGRAATLALHDELALSPKPGLVTLVDNGSHDDMDAHTFMRSLFALRGYFVRIAGLGAAGAPFEELERCGIEAEARMLPYPICERCLSPLKPDVVFFGEPIPMLDMVRANQEARQCKVMLIMGTSGVVYPAADVPYLAHQSGAKIVEINMDDTPFTSSISDFFFKENASDALPKILEHIGT